MITQRLNAKDALLAFFIIFLWASNFIILKKVLMHISLDLFNSMRLAMILPLIFFIKKPSAAIKDLFIIALSWNVCSLAFMAIALEKGLAASYAGLAMQMQVIFDILICYLILKEGLSKKQWLGISLAIGILIYFKLNLSDPFQVEGISFALLAAFSIAFSLSYSKYKKIAINFNHLLWILIFSFPSMVFYSYFFGSTHYQMENILTAPFTFIFYILLSSLCSILFGSYYWFKLNEKYPSISFKPFIFLVPFIVYAESIFLLDEPFEINFILTLSLMIFALNLCQKKQTAQKLRNGKL